jgi:hypothetical protein
MGWGKFRDKVKGTVSRSLGRLDDSVRKAAENPLKGAADYAKRAALGFGGVVGDVMLGYPIWNEGESLTAQSLWGSSDTRNKAWGDPAGVAAGRQEDRDIAAEEAAMRAEAARVQKMIDDMGAVYGIGTSPEAISNARRMSDIIGSQVGGVGAQGAQQLSGDLYQQLQQIQSMFSRSGMTGSGLEQQGIQDALAQYAGQRTGLGSQLEQLRGGLYDTMRGRMQTAQEGIAKGQKITSDMAIRDQISQLNAALASSSGLPGVMSGLTGAAGQGANALLMRAGGASPDALNRALESMRYNYNLSPEAPKG